MRTGMMILLLTLTGGICGSAKGAPAEIIVPSEAGPTPRVHVISGAPALMVWLGTYPNEQGILIQPLSIADGSTGSVQNLGGPGGRLGKGSISGFGNRYAVAWEETPPYPKEPEVVVRTVDPSDGFRIDPPIVVARGEPNKEYARVDSVGTSGLVIWWMEEGPTVDGVFGSMKPMRVMVRQMDSQGLLKQPINVGGADCEGTLSRPGSMSALSDKEVLFAWTCLAPFKLGNFPTGWIPSIRFRKLDLSDMALGEEGKIEDVQNVQFGAYPSVTRLDSGVFLIVWHDEGRKVIRAQRVGNDGKKIGKVFDLIEDVSSWPDRKRLLLLLRDSAWSGTINKLPFTSSNSTPTASKLGQISY